MACIVRVFMIALKYGDNNLNKKHILTQYALNDKKFKSFVCKNTQKQVAK